MLTARSTSMIKDCDSFYSAFSVDWELSVVNNFSDILALQFESVTAIRVGCSQYSITIVHLCWTENISVPSPVIP